VGEPAAVVAEVAEVAEAEVAEAEREREPALLTIRTTRSPTATAREQRWWWWQQPGRRPRRRRHARPERKLRRPQQPRRGGFGGFGGELGLALALELLLDSHVGEALFLDLGELHDLGFGGALERLVLLAGLCRLRFLFLEIGALGPDFLHHCLEVVEFDRPDATCHRRLTLGGDSGVRLFEVDEQRDRATGVDEAALRPLLEAGAHRGRLGFDLGEVLFGCGDLALERVETGDGVEHGLGGLLGAVTGGLDLLGSAHRRRIGASTRRFLGVRHGEWRHGGTDRHARQHCAQHDQAPHELGPSRRHADRS
jgi:hypothetical protein